MTKMDEKAFVETMSKRMMDFARARRNEKTKPKVDNIWPHHISFFCHMPEDVRFGGGGCRGVACALSQKARFHAHHI